MVRSIIMFNIHRLIRISSAEVRYMVQKEAQTTNKPVHRFGELYSGGGGIS